MGEIDLVGSTTNSYKYQSEDKKPQKKNNLLEKIQENIVKMEEYRQDSTFTQQA